MKISIAEVEHVANLARLTFPEDEKELLRSQLDAIISYIGKLGELDTEGVEPTSHVLPIRNVFRTDEPAESLKADEALANAPERSGDFYRVPKIIE